MKRKRNPKMQVRQVMVSDREIDTIMPILYKSLGREHEAKPIYRAIVSIGRKTAKLRGGANDEMDMAIKSKQMLMKWYRKLHRMNRYDYKK